MILWYDGSFIDKTGNGFNASQPIPPFKGRKIQDRSALGFDDREKEEHVIIPDFGAGIYDVYLVMRKSIYSEYFQPFDNFGPYSKEESQSIALRMDGGPVYVNGELMETQAEMHLDVASSCVVFMPSVNIPEGTHRMGSIEDELSMHGLFGELRIYNESSAVERLAVSNELSEKWNIYVKPDVDYSYTYVAPALGYEAYEGFYNNYLLGLTSNGNLSASRSTMGAAIFSNSSKWLGGVLGLNNKIYGIPFTGGGNVLVIDPDNDTATVFTVVSSFSNFSSAGGVLARNGKIYSVPFSTSELLIIDPDTDTATVINTGVSPIGTSYIGGVLGNDDKIYCVPFSGTNLLIIDTLTDTATRTTMGLSFSGSSKWFGGVLGPDGKIYFIPSNANDILIIDTDAGTATRTTMGASLSGSSKWWGGVLGKDGKIYCIPNSATSILIIDTVTNTATLSNMGADLTGGSKWVGGVLGTDGLIYGIPSEASDILIINTDTGTATRSTLGADLTGSSKWWGGTASANGNIYGMPFASPDILKIGVGNTAPIEALTSPYLNKL
jgi:hypothetical protein